MRKWKEAVVVSIYKGKGAGTNPAKTEPFPFQLLEAPNMASDHTTALRKMTNNPSYYLFLDWRQAFDSLDHTDMLLTLKRFGLPRRSP